MSDSPHPRRELTLFVGGLVASLAVVSAGCMAVRAAGYSADDLTPVGPASTLGLAAYAAGVLLTSGAAAALLYPFRRDGLAPVYRRLAAANLVVAVARVCNTAANDRLYPDDRVASGLTLAAAYAGIAVVLFSLARRVAAYDVPPP